MPTGKREEALALLNSGLNPAQIAKAQRVSTTTIISYLDQMVGRGLVRRSDIYFTVRAEARNELSALRASMKRQHPTLDGWGAARRAEGAGMSADLAEEMQVVWHYGDVGNFLGDLFEDLTEIEVTLHRRLGECLQQSFGHSWWNAVPAGVRDKCEKLCRGDDEPFQFTTLMHLADIIESQWQCVRGIFASRYGEKRGELLSALRRMNQIRNVVMHPVRRHIPTEDDVLFVRTLKKDLFISSVSSSS